MLGDTSWETSSEPLQAQHPVHILTASPPLMGSQVRWEDAAMAQLLESFPLTLVLCLSMHIGTTQATLHLHFF